jgi:predicted transcriptional regulator
MNIQYVRLSDDVCETLNRLAHEQRRTVSDVVNEMLRNRLKEIPAGTPGEIPAGAPGESATAG